MTKGGEINLIAEVDDKIPPMQAILLGLQHVLAMDIYIVPIILGGILSLTTGETAFLIQMTFVAAGIATIIQAKFGLKLPVMQGPSYIPIGALGAIGTGLGIKAMIGSLIPGALIIAVLGYPLKLLGKIVKKIIPEIVAGTVIIIVGLALMPVAVNGVYTGTKNVHANLIVGCTSAILLVIFLMIGSRAKGKLRFFRLCSVVLALAVGTIIASFYGMVDFSPVAAASWIAIPKVFSFGVPQFNASAIFTMIFIYCVVLIESTGTWFAVGAVTGKEIDENRINGGAAGEGIGCAIGSLFGGTPVTGYSTNAGIIAITGVASRRAIIAGGGILIALGMIPKFMNVIACIPGVVINGVFAVVTVVIMMNGFRVVKSSELNERNMMVIGLPILVTIATAVMPKDIVSMFPSFINYLISSGMAIGAILAVILNVILPKEKSKEEIKVNEK